MKERHKIKTTHKHNISPAARGERARRVGIDHDSLGRLGASDAIAEENRKRRVALCDSLGVEWVGVDEAGRLFHFTDRRIYFGDPLFYAFRFVFVDLFGLVRKGERAELS